MEARLQILAKIQSEGRTYTWLANQIGCTPQHVSLIMNGGATLTGEKLKAINKALKTKFK